MEKSDAAVIGKFCYDIARGHTNADGHSIDGFHVHGTRQLYWKGRSDVATEIKNALLKKGIKID